MVESLASVLLCIWQNVLGTHHASAHGGSSDLIVKMVDYIILKSLVIYLRHCLRGENSIL